MKVITWILTIVSLLMVFFVIVCGTWIRANKGKIADLSSSVDFHMKLGIAESVIVVITIIVFAVIILKR